MEIYAGRFRPFLAHLNEVLARVFRFSLSRHCTLDLAQSPIHRFQPFALQRSSISWKVFGYSLPVAGVILVLACTTESMPFLTLEKSLDKRTLHFCEDCHEVVVKVLEIAPVMLRCTRLCYDHKSLEKSSFSDAISLPNERSCPG